MVQPQPPGDGAAVRLALRPRRRHGDRGQSRVNQGHVGSCERTRLSRCAVGSLASRSRGACHPPAAATRKLPSGGTNLMDDGDEQLGEPPDSMPGWRRGVTRLLGATGSAAHGRCQGPLRKQAFTLPPPPNPTAGEAFELEPSGGLEPSVGAVDAARASTQGAAAAPAAAPPPAAAPQTPSPQQQQQQQPRPRLRRLSQMSSAVTPPGAPMEALGARDGSPPAAPPAPPSPPPRRGATPPPTTTTTVEPLARTRPPRSPSDPAPASPQPAGDTAEITPMAAALARRVQAQAAELAAASAAAQQLEAELRDSRARLEDTVRR